MTRRSSSATSTRKCAAAWDKVLYKQQPFEDNYVDPGKFLLEMKKNTNVDYYKYWQLVHHTCGILQQLALVVVFVVVFRALVVGDISADSVLTMNASVVAMWILSRGIMLGSDVFHHIRVLVVFTIVLKFMSPLIRTLTINFTSDTIWALTITLLVIHVITFDYQKIGTDKPGPLEGSSTMAISTNSGMFAAVLLSSRMPTVSHTFAFLGFSMIIYAITPTVRRDIRQWSRELFIALTWALSVLSTVFLSDFFPMLAGIFLVVILSIAFLLPKCLLMMQSTLKLQINGPWDEAVPKTSASVEEWRNAGLLQ